MPAFVASNDAAYDFVQPRFPVHNKSSVAYAVLQYYLSSAKLKPDRRLWLEKEIDYL